MLSYQPGEGKVQTKDKQGTKEVLARVFSCDLAKSGNYYGLTYQDENARRDKEAGCSVDVSYSRVTVPRKILRSPLKEGALAKIFFDNGGDVLEINPLSARRRLAELRKELALTGGLADIKRSNFENFAKLFLQRRGQLEESADGEKEAGVGLGSVLPSRQKVA